MLFRRFSIIDLTGSLILTGHFGFLWRFPLTTRSQTSVPRFSNILSIKQDFTTYGIKTRTHYFILSRQASTQPNLLNLNLLFPRRWRRPCSRLSPLSLPPRPGYLKVPYLSHGMTVITQRNSWKSNIHIPSRHYLKKKKSNALFLVLTFYRKIRTLTMVIR